MALRDSSIVHWKHINLHGEYDFSDNLKENSPDFLLPEIMSVNMSKFLEVKNDISAEH